MARSQINGNKVINELNDNMLIPADLIFIVVSTINSNNTPAITEYSPINDSNAFLLLNPIVAKMLTIVAIKIANKK